MRSMINFSCGGIVVFFCLFSPFFLPAQNADSEMSPVAHWSDRLFETKSHDFGTVARGTKAVYHFKMTNPFVEDVHVASINSSCACTRLTLEKSLLKTREETFLIAEFNADQNNYHKSATISIEIDKPFPATVLLSVKGYIRPDVTFTPAQVNFGPVKEGTAASRTIEVTYSGPSSNWRIANLLSPVEYITGEILETKPSPTGGVLTKLKIDLADTAPRGRFSERLILQTNEQGRQGNIPLLIEGSVPGNISVNPNSVFLGFVPPGGESVRDVAIRSDKPFTITKLTSDNPAITVLVPNADKPRMRYQVPVKVLVPEDYTGENIVAKIDVETDDPKMKTTFTALAEMPAKPAAEPPKPAAEKNPSLNIRQDTE